MVTEVLKWKGEQRRERFGHRRTSSDALSYQVAPFGYDSATELLRETRSKDTSTQRNIMQLTIQPSCVSGPHGECVVMLVMIAALQALHGNASRLPSIPEMRPLSSSSRPSLHQHNPCLEMAKKVRHWTRMLDPPSRLSSRISPTASCLSHTTHWFAGRTRVSVHVLHVT
jgi:hypothetical protein